MYADVPYDLTPQFLDKLFTEHNIDYVVHGDDPCLLPDGTDAYAHAKKQGRFRMVRRLCAVPIRVSNSQAKLCLQRYLEEGNMATFTAYFLAMKPLKRKQCSCKEEDDVIQC